MRNFFYNIQWSHPQRNNSLEDSLVLLLWRRIFIIFTSFFYYLQRWGKTETTAATTNIDARDEEKARAAKAWACSTLVTAYKILHNTTRFNKLKKKVAARRKIVQTLFWLGEFILCMMGSLVSCKSHLWHAEQTWTLPCHVLMCVCVEGGLWLPILRGPFLWRIRWLGPKNLCRMYPDERPRQISKPSGSLFILYKNIVCRCSAKLIRCHQKQSCLHKYHKFSQGIEK